MTEKEYALINEKELKRYRMENPHLDDVELMARLNALLARQLHRMKEQQCPSTSRGAEPLSRFASLRPTHEQLRTALLRLLEMPCPGDSSRKLIHKKSHWLAVMRAMQFLGKVNDGYGARQEFVNFLHELLPDDTPNVVAANLKDIESQSPFNKMLTKWHGQLDSSHTRYYWGISITYLECLAG